MASLESGRLLAERYELQDRLGDGGHAEVWKARDGHSGRSVALKFLHSRRSGPEDALPVLQHEAHMARRLEHPGVLKLDDPQRDGTFVFLPMEFAAGGDASWLRGASWQRVLPVLLQTARVLEHAHARGVVHRDLKPRNVLFDSLGNVRISDFGTAASTGSSDAPSTGSPFSASPQQLRDEPATPADDVYGLGALAYELLTRYPPFYPHFDAQRVQGEDPPRPEPVHPAPGALLDLVQAMLARDASGRPDLSTVIAAFEHHLATRDEAGNDEAAWITEPAAAPGAGQLPRPRVRSRHALLWVLGIVASAGAAVLLLLPGPVPTPPAQVSAPVLARPARVADAVMPAAAAAPAASQPAARPAAQPAAAPDASDTALQQALRAGREALQAMQPEQARAAFQRALLLQPGQAQARHGISASLRLDAQLAGMANGAKREAAGDLGAAADQYRLLLANDSSFKPAASALARVEQGQRTRQFEDLLTAGANDLRYGRVDEAGAAYQQAARIKPDDARLRAGQQRVNEVLASRRNAEDLATGVRLEGAEQWDAAVAHYRAVLARDPTLGFAQDGLARSERRAALDHELGDYLARPQRLTAPAVRQAAERAMARGEATAGAAPRLHQQLHALHDELAQLAVAVPVAISSDNSTQVSLAPVGDLGSFSSRELQLPPGHYILTGRRDGFRDVRYEFEIAPGQDAAEWSVKCTERI